MKAEGLLKFGIAVKDLEKTVSDFAQAFQLVPEEVANYEPGGMRYCLLNVGETMIEVMEPTTPNGPIGRFISRRGEGLQHMTLKVSSIENAIADLKQRGIQFVQETPLQEEVRSGTFRYVFLQPKSCHGVLIQLMEYIAKPVSA